MISIIECAYLPSMYLFWWVFKSFAPFLIGCMSYYRVVSLGFSFFNYYYYSRFKSLVGYTLHKYFLQVCGLPFHFLKCILKSINFKFQWSPTNSFIVWDHYSVFEKFLPKSKSLRFFPAFFQKFYSRSFYI